MDSARGVSRLGSGVRKRGGRVFFGKLAQNRFRNRVSETLEKGPVHREEENGIGRPNQSQLGGGAAGQRKKSFVRCNRYSLGNER